MKVLRFILEVVLGIILFPAILIVSLMWLCICIRAAHYMNESTKEGFKVWWNYIKVGIQMNKDFVINGLEEV